MYNSQEKSDSYKMNNPIHYKQLKINKIFLSKKCLHFRESMTIPELSLGCRKRKSQTLLGE
jgi:hypothetical protein